MFARADNARLERHHFVLRPNVRRGRRRAEPVTLAYRDIADIAIVEPFEGERRRLVVRLVDGSTVVLPFTRRSTLKMRMIRHRAWKRVRAARRSPDAADQSQTDV